ncbi:MAG: FMN-binding protein [Synergistes sp.]|nr:FMN-binding protein [Synergistes sp.]
MNIRITRIAAFLVIFAAILSAAFLRDGRLFGMGGADTNVPTEEIAEDGSRVIRTDELGKDIMGYSGAVPVNVYIKDGKITKVEAGENYETLPFMAKVEKRLMPLWAGLTPEEALDKKIDAVSGATYTSKAVIENVRLALEYALDKPAGIEGVIPPLHTAAGIAVALCGLILPFFIKSRRYRIIQLIANTAVLGFWCGTFISVSILVNFAANGAAVLDAVLVIMLFSAFITPLFGYGGHYCSRICPFGSLQELLGMPLSYKIKIPVPVLRSLTYLREVLCIILIVSMWFGIGFRFISGELFSAFIVRNASPIVLVLAGAFLALSLVTPRPYCRFLCPTGTLIKFAQGDCTIAPKLPRRIGLTLAAVFIAVTAAVIFAHPVMTVIKSWQL